MYSLHEKLFTALVFLVAIATGLAIVRLQISEHQGFAPSAPAAYLDRAQRS